MAAKAARAAASSSAAHLASATPPAATSECSTDEEDDVRVEELPDPEEEDEQLLLPPLLVFGLPGNPVSAFACFHLVVAPAIRALCGDRYPLPRRLMATLAGPFKTDAERPEYHRADEGCREEE